MSLRTVFDSVQSQLKDALAEGQDPPALQALAKEDPDLGLRASRFFNDLRQGLDDILLRQQFWAEDVGYENDPFGIIGKESSDAVKTLSHLTAILSIVKELSSGIAEILSLKPKR